MAHLPMYGKINSLSVLFHWDYLIMAGLMAIQTLWAGPWMIRVAGYSPLESATGLFWINITMLVSFFLWGYFLPKITNLGFSAIKILILGIPLSFLVMLTIILLGPKGGCILYNIIYPNFSLLDCNTASCRTVFS